MTDLPRITRFTASKNLRSELEFATKDDIITFLTNLESIPSHAKLDINDGDSWDSGTIQFVYYEEESDADYEVRLTKHKAEQSAKRKAAAEKKKKSAADRRKLYEELKKEFG